MSVQKYDVSEGIVLHVVYYSGFLPEIAKESRGSEKKSEVWNVGSLKVPLNEKRLVMFAQLNSFLNIKSVLQLRLQYNHKCGVPTTKIRHCTYETLTLYSIQKDCFIALIIQ